MGQFFFARFQKFAKSGEFVAHAVEHLADRVDFHFAALEAVNGETDGEIFGEAEHAALVHFRVG